MEHSKMFEMLENHYESIELYELGQRDIRIKSFMFWLDLEQVNSDFHNFGKISLLDEELPIVQGWINKAIGNRNIPQKTREDIALAGVQFASMVESINNSHISTIN